MQQSFALDTSFMRNIAGSVNWQAGARFGINQGLPELYVRILTMQEIGSWLPEAGLELGLTRRAKFENDDMLLRETRHAMEGNISKVYIAVHTSPLSFRINRNWQLNCLDFQVGTHLGNTGRTMRVQVGLLTLGKLQ